MIEPGVAMYWFGADLYYANVNHFVEQANLLVSQPPAPLHWLVVDASAITDLDFTAAQALIELRKDLSQKDVALALARVNANLKAKLDRQGVTPVIGSEHIFSSRKHCLKACRGLATR